jgi:hypothetical protein
MEILYDLYTDALLLSHRGKTLAPASHYMVFKDLEEIIHRQYSKAQRDRQKIASLTCPYCDLPVDYLRSPPPDYNPPKRPFKDKRSRSRGLDPDTHQPVLFRPHLCPQMEFLYPKKCQYLAHTWRCSISMIASAIFNVRQHLDVCKILKTTDTARARTRELRLA